MFCSSRVWRGHSCPRAFYRVVSTTACTAVAVCQKRFCRPFGAGVFAVSYPRLTPWALFLRRFAAFFAIRHWALFLRRFAASQSSLTGAWTSLPLKDTGTLSYAVHMYPTEHNKFRFAEQPQKNLRGEARSAL